MTNEIMESIYGNKRLWPNLMQATTRHLPQGNEKNHENSLSQDNRSRGQNWNPGPTENELC